MTQRKVELNTLQKNELLILRSVRYFVRRLGGTMPWAAWSEVSIPIRSLGNAVRLPYTMARSALRRLAKRHKLIVEMGRRGDGGLTRVLIRTCTVDRRVTRQDVA